MLVLAVWQVLPRLVAESGFSSPLWLGAGRSGIAWLIKLGDIGEMCFGNLGKADKLYGNLMSSSPWLIFFFGCMIGWGAQYLLDRFYLRRRLLDELSLMEQASATSTLARLEPDRGVSHEVLVERRSLSSEGDEPELVPAFLQSSLPNTAVVVVEDEVEETPVIAVRDRLTLIKGIGPIYESRLVAAGIGTFAALARCTPDQIESIIQPEPWRRVDLESWVRQAQGLNRELSA